MEGIAIYKIENINSNVSIDGIIIPLKVDAEYKATKLTGWLNDISNSEGLNLTEFQKENLRYSSAQKFYTKLNEMNIIKRDRTDVWNVTDEYVHLIGVVLKFNSGNIIWLGNKALEFVMNILIDENDVYQISKI